MIQNVNGEQHCTFNLNVSGRSRSSLSQRVASPTGSYSSRRSAKAPIVTSQLHASLKMDGTVQLECAVLDPASITNVIWYHNDRRITSFDSRMSQSTNNDQFTLTISGITENDAGHFACHLSGSRDSTTTSCDMSMEKIQGYVSNIRKLSKPVEQSPVAAPALSIDPMPSTCDVQSGRVLSLNSTFSGNPTSVQWSLNGVSLSDGAEGGRISIQTSSSSSTITVLSVQSDDAGTYKLKIQSADACDSPLSTSTSLVIFFFCITQLFRPFKAYMLKPQRTFPGDTLSHVVLPPTLSTQPLT